MNHGPKLNRDWVGLRVKLLRAATNRYGRLPAGVTGTITVYSPGRAAICFEADACEKCGVGVNITGMHREDFEILTALKDWPDTTGKGRR